MSYQKYVVKTWQSIENRERAYWRDPTKDRRWVFRGERDGKALKTSLDRMFDLYAIKDKNRGSYERESIREFQRKASLYMRTEPDRNDILEWLAVMRHHGAPTRFLDFTYSFYVALYFALAQTEKGTVWAIHVETNPEPILAKIKTDPSRLDKFGKLRKRLEGVNDLLRIRADGDKLDDLAIVSYLMETPVPLVYAVNPFRLNRRLTSQQGLFLVSGDVRKPFDSNLKHHFGRDTKRMQANIHQIQFVGNGERRKEVIRRLREMNISSESLFQDLDGLARSTAEMFARDRGIRRASASQDSEGVL